MRNLLQTAWYRYKKLVPPEKRDMSWTVFRIRVSPKTKEILENLRYSGYRRLSPEDAERKVDRFCEICKIEIRSAKSENRYVYVRGKHVYPLDEISEIIWRKWI